MDRKLLDKILDHWLDSMEKDNFSPDVPADVKVGVEDRAKIEELGRKMVMAVERSKPETNPYFYRKLISRLEDSRSGSRNLTGHPVQWAVYVSVMAIAITTGIYLGNDISPSSAAEDQPTEVVDQVVLDDYELDAVLTLNTE